jgi:hypothetical protein
MHVDALFGLRACPPIAETAAGKHQRLRAPVIDHSGLQIVPEWCFRNRVPHLKSLRRNPMNALISVKSEAAHGA